MNKVNPTRWVPSLYFMEALPYVAVNVISVIMYKEMGLSNTELALYTSWMYLPWVIKPLWSPVVDSIATERKWIIITQLLCGAGLAGVAFTLPTSYWLQASIAFLWLVAFSSATHDIAADGFYIVALDSNKQALFVGIRSTFYRIGMIFGQGLLVMMAGWIQNGARFGNSDDAFALFSNTSVDFAWAVTFMTMAVIALILMAYHKFALPKADKDVEFENSQQLPLNKVLKNTAFDFWKTVKIFFSKKQIWAALLFMLLFRFPEAQLVKIASPFMLDEVGNGGMGLTTEFVGFIYGTVGVIGLLIGGILGGVLVARHGLKRWLWPMVMAISIPDAVYLYMSLTQTDSAFLIASCVFVEQLGYGFGFTAYMMFLIYFARGESSTSVYALCTAFMALGMMLPGMMAGWLSDVLGYQNFFIWILVACSVTFIVTAFLHIDPEFGKKVEKKD